MADSSPEKTSMAAKNTSEATSDEAENIAESLSSLSMTTTTTTSDNNPSSSSTIEDAEPEENPGDVLFSSRKYDFALLLKPSRILKHAIEALSDLTFNKPKNEKSDPKFKTMQSALINVSPIACVFTVRSVDSETGTWVVGCLRLKEDGLEAFHCSKPFRKMVNLNGLARLLRDPANFDHEGVVMFVEQGTNFLSFQWGTSNLDFALGHPVNIDLHDAKTDYYIFPPVNYALKAAMPSEELRALLTKLRDSYAFKIPDFVELYLRSGAVKMMVDDIASSTLEMNKEDSDVVWMNWKVFRNSLEKASHITENCTVYLLTEPPESIMLQFDLELLGDMAYLCPAQIVSRAKIVSQPQITSQPQIVSQKPRRVKQTGLSRFSKE